MAYLKRVQTKPAPPTDMRGLEKRFDANAYEINIDGGRVEWGMIDEVEAARAARMGTPAGWLVKKVVYGGDDRYHVGVFFGRGELVLSNITLEQARYVLDTIAYYAPNLIRYVGQEGIVDTIES